MEYYRVELNSIWFDVCRTCGCVIFDLQVHANWHTLAAVGMIT